MPRPASAAHPVQVTAGQVRALADSIARA